MVETVAGLLAMLLLVALNGVFVALEFALLAVDRAKIAGRAAAGSTPARLTEGALKQLSFFLSGAQLGITVTSLVLGFLAEPLVGRLLDPLLDLVGLERGSSMSVVLALLIATVFQMVVGELIPKNLSIARPEAVALTVTPPSRVAFTVLRPVIRGFNAVANWTVRQMGVEPREELAGLGSIEELDYLIRSSAETGSLGEDELGLLRRTLRFGQKSAAEALTPRVHLEAVPLGATTAELRALAGDTGHSHYPVYGEDLDDIRGVISVTDLYTLPVDEREGRLVGELMDVAHVVPETRALTDLLDDFERSGAELLIVVDEHGGTAGIVTLEDVLEEITGDIDDEYDPQVPLSVVRPGVSVVAGTSTIDEVADASGFRAPEGHYETIAGFLLDRFGRIPDAGDTLEWDGWGLEVVEMDRLRIASVQLVAPDVGPVGSS